VSSDRPPGPSRSTVLMALAVLVVGSALAMNTWALLDRMLLPHEVDGTVEIVQHRNRTGQGTDVWLIRMEDGTEYFADEPAGSLVSSGDRLQSATWSRQVTVEGRPSKVPFTRVTWGPLAWSVLCVGVVVWLLFYPASRAHRPDGSAQSGQGLD